MRVSTLWQPWATLVVAGIKSPENRTTPFPSTVELPATIGIHAGQSIDDAALRGRQVLEALDAIGWGYRPLPTGALIGFVTIIGSHHAGECLRCFACETGRDVGHDHGLCSTWAQPAVYHWVPTEPIALEHPVPMRGQQGLWRLPDGYGEQLLAQVAA